MFDIKRYFCAFLFMGLLMNAFSQTAKLDINKEIGSSNAVPLSSGKDKKSSSSDESYLTIADLKEQQSGLKNINPVAQQPSPANSSSSPFQVPAVLPPSLLNGLGAAKSPSGRFELVGLFLGPESSHAEVSIGGMSHFYQVGDLLNQDWVIDAIDSKGIQVSRCKTKSGKCEMKRVSYLGGLEP